MANTNTSSATKDLPNGDGMAAIVAAGVGSAALGIFAFLGDAFKGIGQFFIFYRPTGPLSGVTLSAIAVWLAAWYVLAKRWGGRDVAVARASGIAFALLIVGLLFTFPPFMDLLQGK